MSINHYVTIFSQQRKLIGSPAQNSSGVRWCRRRVRFNEFPEKVPKVPEKVWEALVQSLVRFNRVPRKVPEKVPGSLGAKPPGASFVSFFLVVWVSYLNPENEQEFTEDAKRAISWKSNVFPFG